MLLLIAALPGIAQQPSGDRLARLHEAVDRFGDAHDLILKIGRIGDATFVPVLIDASARLGDVQANSLQAVVCTRVHASTP